MIIMNAYTIAKYSKALGHPMRARIVEILLNEGECITGDLCERLPVAQSTVSQHLKILKENGLICGQVDGPKRCYCINGDALDEFKQLVENL